MISRLGQALPRRLVPSSNVAGGSLLERLRSTSFALCGAVTAVGLGMIALVANQGWPGPIDNAIPPIPREGVHGAQVVAGPSSQNGVSNNPGGRLSGTSTPAATGGSGASGARPASDQQFAVGSPGPDSPAAVPPGGHGGVGGGGQGGVGAPAGAPTPEQPASVVPQPASGPAPVSTPAPVEPPVAEKSSPGNGKAKGHEKHSVPAGGESPPPVKEKHSHAPPPASPATDPPPPAAPESSAQPKSVPPGKGRGHYK